MNDKRQCWYIATEGENAKTLAQTFDWAKARLAETPSPPGLLLAIDSKNMLKSGPLLSVLGEEVCAQLNRQERTHAPGLGEVTVQSLHKNNPMRRSIYQWDGLIVAVYPSRDLLAYVDAIEGVREIIVAPWFMKEVEDWLQRWNAQEIGNTAAAGETGGV